MALLTNPIQQRLEYLADLWNTTIDKVTIDWKPDYALTDRRNVAALFVTNLNRLAEVLELQQGKFLVANLLLPYVTKDKMIIRWLEDYLALRIHPRLKLLITDSTGKNTYSHLSSIYSDDIYTWEPKIDTPNVICQVAAMGDPLDPGTGYRLSFAKLIKAIGENKFKEVKKEAGICLKIACDNVTKDPYWIMQVTTIHILMSTEYFKRDQIDRAFVEADSAIKMGETAPQVLSNAVGLGILAQTQLNKATMLCVKKKWNDSAALYEQAGENMAHSNSFLLAIDAYRMAAYCNLKKHEEGRALQNLVAGYRLSDRVPDKELKSSTFSILLQFLVKINDKEAISPDELETKASRIYGKEWRDRIKEKWSFDKLEDLYEEHQPYKDQIAKVTA